MIMGHKWKHVNCISVANDKCKQDFYIKIKTAYNWHQHYQKLRQKPQYNKTENIKCIKGLGILQSATAHCNPNSRANTWHIINKSK